MVKLTEEQQAESMRLLARLYVHLSETGRVFNEIEREADRLRAATARLALEADQLLRKIEGL